MCNKCLTRGLAVVPVVALAVGVAALGTAALAVGYSAAAQTAVQPGLAPTTTSRDWQETAGSASRPPIGRF